MKFLREVFGVSAHLRIGRQGIAVGSQVQHSRTSSTLSIHRGCDILYLVFKKDELHVLGTIKSMKSRSNAAGISTELTGSHRTVSASHRCR